MSGVTLVGTPTQASASGASVTGSWGVDQPRTSGDVLIAVVFSAISTATVDTISNTGGTWTKLEFVNSRASSSDTGTAHIWVSVFGKVASGSDAAPTFTTGSGTDTSVVLYELSDVDTSSGITGVVDKATFCFSGTSSKTVDNTVLNMTQTGLAGAGEFTIVGFGQERAANSSTFANDGAGTRDIASFGSSAILYCATVSLANPNPTTENYNGQFGQDGTAYGAGVAVAFLPAPVNINVTGVAATVSVGATGGSVTATTVESVNVAGVAATVAVAAPAGSVTATSSVSVSGQVATVTVDAPSGSVSTSSSAGVNVTGVAAAVAVNAPAGSVTATKNVDVAGVAASITVEAPAGSVATGSVTIISGVAASVAVAAPAGSVTTTANVSISGVAAGVTVAGVPGTVFIRGVRPPQHLGGTATIAIAINGSAVATGINGSATQTTINGAGVVAAGINGAATVAASINGAATAVTIGGSASIETINGSAVGWTMQSVDLVLPEFNDVTVDLTFTESDGSTALDLTTATSVDVFLKTAAGDADDAASTVKLSSAGTSPAVTITSASGGTAEVVIPSADLDITTIAFWRADVVDSSGNRNTAMKGTVTVTPL